MEDPPLRAGPLESNPASGEPFEDASGPVRGEGATVLVLESLEAAAARGARALGEIRGAAWRSGARAAAIPPALEAAGLAPGDIGWIYGSAAGDPAQDAAALRSKKR